MNIIENPEHPMPWVNLNGNTSENLLADVYNVVAAYHDVIIAVQKSDLFHGRNGMDNEHRSALSSKKNDIVNELQRMHEYFCMMADWIEEHS